MRSQHERFFYRAAKRVLNDRVRSVGVSSLGSATPEDVMDAIAAWLESVPPPERRSGPLQKALANDREAPLKVVTACIVDERARHAARAQTPEQKRAELAESARARRHADDEGTLASLEEHEKEGRVDALELTRLRRARSRRQALSMSVEAMEQRRVELERQRAEEA